MAAGALPLFLAAAEAGGLDDGHPATADVGCQRQRFRRGRRAAGATVRARTVGLAGGRCVTSFHPVVAAQGRDVMTVHNPAAGTQKLLLASGCTSGLDCRHPPYSDMGSVPQ